MSARLDARIAVALGLCAFALYAASLPPSFAFWDTGELQTVSAILGIAHPPACPAFVLLGWLVVHAVPVGEAAWRVNVMCAASVALAAAFAYPVARRFGVSPVVAACCTLGFAGASVVWTDATRAEVQDVALLFRVLALVFALRYLDGSRGRDLFVAALALGLAGATHGIAVLLVPALLLLVSARARDPQARASVPRARAGDPRAGPNVPRAEALAFAVALGGVALGLLPYAYLPLRSAWLFAHHTDPTLGLGLPPGLPFWDYDHPATWNNFVRVLTGADFDVHSGFAGFTDATRYPAYAAALALRLGTAFGYGGAILAVVGTVVLVAARRRDGIALLLAAVLPVPYTEAYVELQDPDRYYLLALWCAAIVIGVGFERAAALAQLRGRSIGRLAIVGALVASFVAAAPARASLFAQRDDPGAREYVADVRSVVPDNAIVLAEWAYATPLAYAAYVDGDFGGRIVVAASPEQYLAYVPRWLTQRPVYVVSFSASLDLPGFAVESVRQSSYHVYRIAALRART